MQIFDAITPLGDALKRAALESDVIFTDDSIIPLQVKGSGKVKKARLWVYVRGGSGPPLTVYDFSRGTVITHRGHPEITAELSRYGSVFANETPESLGLDPGGMLRPYRPNPPGRRTRL